SDRGVHDKNRAAWVDWMFQKDSKAMVPRANSDRLHEISLAFDARSGGHIPMPEPGTVFAARAMRFPRTLDLTTFLLEGLDLQGSQFENSLLLEGIRIFSGCNVSDCHDLRFLTGSLGYF